MRAAASGPSNGTDELVSLQTSTMPRSRVLFLSTCYMLAVIDSPFSLVTDATFAIFD